MTKEFVFDGANGMDMAIDVVNFEKAPGGYDKWWNFRYYRVMELPEEMQKEIGFSEIKPSVYIAGPMTGYPKLNYDEFDRAEALLEGQYTVINPVNLDRDEGVEYSDTENQTQEEYLSRLNMSEIIKRDLASLAACKYIYMLTGWEKSKGARAEHAFAVWSGIEVLYQESVDEAQERKDTPVFSGVLKYFPDAIREIAVCSRVGNDQHNPGSPLHWDRSKSQDELDSLARHLIDAGTLDSDGVRHSTKVAWRALANLQKELEG